LYGDRRGFRTRHHREHVEGDYKNPPAPGQYEAVENRSRQSLQHAPVELSKELREVVGRAVKERLEDLGGLVIAVAACRQHLHVLVKMPSADARDWVAIAKRHTWFVLRERGWKEKLWGKRCQLKAIRDRQHQLNAYYYIGRHADQGAWVWLWTKKD
jgi:hypothetical protein